MLVIQHCRFPGGFLYPLLILLPGHLLTLPLILGILIYILFLFSTTTYNSLRRALTGTRDQTVYCFLTP